MISCIQGMYDYELKNNRCTFTFQDSAEHLYRSISATKSLSGCMCSSDYRKISFHAHDVEPLDKFLIRTTGPRMKVSYHQAVRMITHIGSQLYHLERQKKSLLWLEIGNIYVINNNYFFYFGNQEVVSLDAQDNILFFTPRDISSNGFIAPEYLSVRTIPSLVPKQAPYYSLGAIVIYCMFSDINPRDILLSDLDSIIDTKLYWFLRRAIVKQPRRRVLLYV